MARSPVLFVSHGAPDLAIADAPASRFLREVGGRLDRPRAILLVSAHHEAASPELTGSPFPETIRDFGGFDPRLRAMTYPAPGAPQLAARIAADLTAAGFSASVNPSRGLDHGAWVPLSLIVPSADVPVVSLSISPSRDAAWHRSLGEALIPLRDEGLLMIGSGSATHDLRSLFGGRDDGSEPPDWANEFADWLGERIEAGDEDAVLHAVERGPHGVRNHPTPDHILPLFVAMGAAGGDPARVLHRSFDRAVLAMDVYGWGNRADLDGLSDASQRNAGPTRQAA